MRLMQSGAAVLASLLACAQLVGPAQAQAGLADDTASAAYRFKRLDVPGTSNTEPSSIDASGQVTGWYIDAKGSHGFIYRGRKYTTLDVPGGGETKPMDSNRHGEVTGTYFDSKEGRQHGFLYSSGTYTTLDVPGGSATNPAGINASGQVTGSDLVATGFRGFLYSGGAYTAVDVPGAAETVATAINNRGQVTGNQIDAKGKSRWFVYSGGTYTTLDVPGCEDLGFGFPGSDMNDSGQVTGSCNGPGIPKAFGFVYSAGTYTILDVPGASGTFPSSINNSGQVAGWYRDAESRTHGFVYSGGTYTTLDVPGAANGTFAASMNASGVVAGHFFDEKGEHGFIATPVVGVLDNFDRADGNLGQNWAGKSSIAGYRIANEQTHVAAGGPIYWQLNPFGLDQEAFVTLTRIDPAGAEQGLLLKVQGGTGNYRKGAIAVKYDADQQVIRVATWRPRKASWRNYRDLPVAFADGDKLGARVLADGKVRIFRNEQEVGTITLGPVDRQFFNERTGRVGLWFENAPNAIVDDFCGGTRIP